ncbi:hypothetical protein QE429_000554 [Bacillus sp. SORGH_AS 510]|nr:hypothetical protein [Bacillus sp. SORGH_AS_0510]
MTLFFLHNYMDLIGFSTQISIISTNRRFDQRNSTKPKVNSTKSSLDSTNIGNHLPIQHQTKGAPR